MVSLQVQLTEEQARRLEEIAVIRGVPQADLVRQAVETLLARTRSNGAPKNCASARWRWPVVFTPATTIPPSGITTC